MKNRNLFISTISAISGAAITLPLALTTASCSCSRNKFAGDDVLEEIYEPNIGQLDDEGPILLSEGTEEWWNYLVDHKNMPQEEYRWTSSWMASIGKYLIGSFPEGRFNITQWTGRLSNFKINDASKKRVSYVATQQIGVDINLKEDKECLNLSSEDPIKSVKGHLGLSWRYEVKNTPIGCFDFDPSGLIGGQIYGDDETVWYIAPDLSSIEAGDDSWSINYDFLPDINLVINDQEIIKLNNELQFSFDKTLAGIIESGFSDENLPFAYFIERMIGLISGWNSYYLSQTKQAAHIDWDNSKWQNVTPDEDGFVTTGFGQAPIYDFKINDGLYGKDELYTTMIGLHIDFSDPYYEISLNDIDLSPELTYQNIVGYNNQILSVAYDFYGVSQDDGAYERFEPGKTYQDKYDEGILKYNAILPVIITKDWISIGGLNPKKPESNDGDDTPEIIRLKEAAANDQYVKYSGSKYLTTTETAEYKADISFPISEALYNDWKAHWEDSKYYIQFADAGDGENRVDMLGYDLVKSGNDYFAKVTVECAWDPNVGDKSNNFNISFVEVSTLTHGARIQFKDFWLEVTA